MFPVIVGLIVVLAGGILIDRQSTYLNVERARTSVAAQAALVRAKLEGNINGNIQLVRGLVATIATEPNMNQDRFSALVGNLMEEQSQLRAIAAAPNLVVTMIYPIVGNQAAIGLNYRDNPEQSVEAMLARESGQLVLAGPVDLVQGGRGFIGRFPVYTDTPTGTQFWGVVSAVVDVYRLYADSGLSAETSDIEISLTAKNAAGQAGARFFGADLSGQDPVMADVIIPSGSWQIAAIPKGGWASAEQGSWQLRLALILAGGLILLPIFITGHWISERQVHFAELKARNRDLEAARSSIEYNALHDVVTGLPNRRYLDEKLSALQPGGHHDGGGLALLHLDLDRFKQINDTLGHAAGDAMLVHASGVLLANCRDSDFAARVGGDEFVLLTTAVDGDIYLATLAERIVKQMRLPVEYEGHQCRFGVSIGIAAEREQEIDSKRLLINADIALYRAKARGRNRFEFFSDALQAEVVNTKRVADEILSGLERAEFGTYYQPQFDARTLDVVGVEALARWHHPTEGVKTPDSFLPVAEELNVVSIIDRLILEQALADLDRWEAKGLYVPRASVNVSLRRLHDEHLINGLRELAIAPGRIAFELVESIYLDESDEIVGWNIEQFKALGIDVEIDDFGTGYASIVSLQKLRPKRLKIDRQLVAPILTDLTQRRLLVSIIDIGKSMNIEIVAEGVETMEHARILRDLGCDILQGYAFARPMSADGIEALLRAQSWRPAQPRITA